MLSAFSPSEVFHQLAEWPVDNVSAVCGRFHSGTEDSHDISWQKLASWGDPEHSYELASLTKILVTLTALIAVVEEAITLDDPVGPPGSTVRHLLSHASGLATDSYEIMAPPAQQRIYSSTGFEVLAEYIAEATQMEFQQYFHEALCDSLDLQHTQLYGSAGFGAKSTIADLSAIAQEILQPHLIPRELMAEVGTIQFPSLNGFVPGYGKHHPNDWGLGLEYHDHKFPHWLGKSQPASVIGHFGQAGTFFWVDFELETATIVLTDRKFGMWAKERWSDFNDALYQAIVTISHKYLNF